MSLNASQQALLNTLIYLKSSKDKDSPLYDPNGDLWDDLWDRGKHWDGSETLGQLLSRFTEDELKRIESAPGTGEFMSGKEIARVIRSIQRDPDLRDLTCADKDSYTGADNKTVTFLSPGGSDAYIIYRGTGSGEWPDNIAGLDETDTFQQQEAAEYARYIHGKYPKANVRVSGHSKGGNKAAYTAIMCPFVTEAISFDGQGFSPAFIEKYKDKIAERQHVITAYNQRNDFVSPLLSPIAGKTVYVDGLNKEGNPLKFHAPVTLFVPKGDVFVLGPTDGVERSEIATKIREFTEFLATVAPYKDLYQLSEYLQKLIPLLMAEKKDWNAIFSLLLDPENEDDLALLIGYIMAYDDSSFLPALILFFIPDAPEKIQQLLTAILSGSAKALPIIIAAIMTDPVLCLLLGAGVLALLDHFIGKIGCILSKAQEVEKRVRKRAKSSANGQHSGFSNGARIRDFSEAKEWEILTSIDSMEGSSWFDPFRWSAMYAGEEFIRRLAPNSFAASISKLFRWVFDENGRLKSQVKQKFAKARAKDSAFAGKINEQQEQLMAMKTTVKDALTITTKGV